MNKANLEIYRFTENESRLKNGYFFKVFILPEDSKKIILAYKNHFTGEIERVQDNHWIQTLYQGLSKLENEDLEKKSLFNKKLKTLLSEEQAAIRQMAMKIKFKEKDVFYFYQLWWALNDAQEAGFFEGLASITEIKNIEANSAWEIKERNTRLEKGFYHLSGGVELSEFFDLNFVNLPFSRANFLRNPDHWGLGFVEKQLIKIDEHTFKAVDEYELCWDRTVFLFETLLPVLEKAYPFRDQVIEIEYEATFPDEFWESLDDVLTKKAKRILEDIPADDWAFVYELFEEAEKQGFTALYCNRNVPKVLELIPQISDFYAKHTPEYFKYNQIEPATEDEILFLEKELGEPLPGDYKTFLIHNRLAFSIKDNYQILSFKMVVKNWKRLNLLKKEGAFDKILEENEASGNWKGDYIKKEWWSEKWLPITEDSCGNLYCIDFSPGLEGMKYQLNYMEIQDNRGPFAFPKAMLFVDLLQKHREYLYLGKFEMILFGDGFKMIEIRPDSEY